ncbi:MAG TPA: monovalent cation/H+ antiporter complex subunit F [Propionibacteriaceae bacterium]|nr:monovalent cation/H+ antiporter complex subunit F [Propionibacteriaceae bacterium]
MTTVTWVVVAIDAAMLTVAAVLSVLRVARGPRALDRIVASDVLVAVVIASAGLAMVATGSGLLLPVILGMSLLAFTSAVAVGRLIRTKRDIK